MVDCYTNRGSCAKQDSTFLTHSVSKRICYELDPSYFRQKTKEYRERNLEAVKKRQKAWYDRQPKVIEKRKIALEKLKDVKDSSYYGVNRVVSILKSKRNYKTRKLSDYNKRKVIKELNNKFKFKLIKEKLEEEKKPRVRIEAKTTTISFD